MKQSNFLSYQTTYVQQSNQRVKKFDGCTITHYLISCHIIQAIFGMCILLFVEILSISRGQHQLLDKKYWMLTQNSISLEEVREALVRYEGDEAAGVSGKVRTSRSWKL